jgi:hypothetical protein
VASLKEILCFNKLACALVSFHVNRISFHNEIIIHINVNVKLTQPIDLQFQAITPKSKVVCRVAGGCCQPQAP